MLIFVELQRHVRSIWRQIFRCIQIKIEKKKKKQKKKKKKQKKMKNKGEWGNGSRKEMEKGGLFNCYLSLTEKISIFDYRLCLVWIKIHFIFRM